MSQPKKVNPPISTKQTNIFSWLGENISDDYFWLREKTDPAVREYLEAENAYAHSVMANTESLQKEIFTEIKQRTKETDMSVPILVDSYLYYIRTEEGKQYPVYCRKKDETNAVEEILLDQNVLAAQYEYFDLGIFSVSPSHDLLAYSIDTNGSERYLLRILNLETGEYLTDSIDNVCTSFVWAADSQSFWYVTRNEAMRPDTVYRHILGTQITDDVRVWHESDERFFVSLEKTKDKQYVFIAVESMETSERHYLRADMPDMAPVCIVPRSTKHQYQLEHREGVFYILSNHDAPDFRLWTVAVTSPEQEKWQLRYMPPGGVVLDGIEMFANFFCLFEMREGVEQIRVEYESGKVWYVPMAEKVYSIHSHGNPNFQSTKLRVHYSSLATPGTVLEIDIHTKQKTILKVQEVRGYDPSLYTIERIYATAQDGESIPISLVYRKDRQVGGPCLLEGYGSYGEVEPVGFRSGIISLLDRVFVFAIAHVRGGGEKGRAWYEAGKYLQKKNTFTDFIAVAEHLCQTGYTNPDSLVAIGGSAGGLLVGAVANMRPDLFQTIVAEVPFVDVVHTMCDASLPLTTHEYEEWGDPNDEEYFQYMCSYSPYENVAKQAYPHMLVEAGWHDTRVAYWEAAKWVAKLREYKIDKNILLLKTDMSKGHTGASGRYQAWHDAAYRYAFIVHSLKMTRQDMTNDAEV